MGLLSSSSPSMYSSSSSWMEEIVYMLMIGCALAVVIIPLGGTGYVFYHGVWKKHHFSKGDKVYMRFHGSPAVMAMIAFGWPQQGKHMLSNLSDQDRVDISPCGGLNYYVTNGGSDWAQAVCKCKEMSSSFDVKHRGCNPQNNKQCNSGGANPKCMQAIAYPCPSGDRDCNPIKGHGFTGNCIKETKSWRKKYNHFCEPAQDCDQMPKNPVSCVAKGDHTKGTHGKCQLFSSIKSCAGQMACCKTKGYDSKQGDCAGGQLCCSPKGKYDPSSNQNCKNRPKVCCGGIGTYLVQKYPLRAEGEVEKEFDGNTYGIKWHAIKVIGGGNPEEECRILRHDKNKEIWDIVFGSPDHNPKGISNIADQNTSNGTHRNAWHLLSHKVNGSNLGRLYNGYTIQHKSVPGKAPRDNPCCPARAKYNKCPSRMPYVTSDDKENAGNVCCARPPKCKTKRIPGTDNKHKKVCICPDSTQCQIGDVSVSEAAPFCENFPWGGNKKKPNNPGGKVPRPCPGDSGWLKCPDDNGGDGDDDTRKK